MKQGNRKNMETNEWKRVEYIIDWFLQRILHIKINDKQLKNLLQFVKFGIVGVSNTIISYVIYVVVLVIFQMNEWFPNADYIIAQIFAFILSVLWSFYWNNKYVFKLSNKSLHNVFIALIKTYVSYAFTGLFLNSILSLFWVEILHINKLFAPIINLLISVPLNFLLNKFWAFKEKKQL